MVTMLGMLGVSKELALLLSVEIGLLTLLVSLPGGVLWLFIREEKTSSGASQGEQSASQLRDSDASTYV